MCSLNDKTVLFQAIQFSIKIQYSSIWPNPGQSGPRSDGNEEVLRIPEFFFFALLEPYHQIVQCYIRIPIGRGYYHSAEKHSVYSTATAAEAKAVWVL